MTQYLVEWKIDIEANNEVEAAMIAHDIQLDPESMATCFSVSRKENSQVVEVDTSREYNHRIWKIWFRED